jgi:hypothetical protein
MVSRLGPIDVCCDAPPYRVVAACRGLGFRAPLDVRWCRRSHLPHEPPERGGILSLRTWKRWLGLLPPVQSTCTCGEALPALEWYTVSLYPEGRAGYLLGQCRRCHTMFWEPLLPFAWAEEGE